MLVRALIVGWGGKPMNRNYSRSGGRVNRGIPSINLNSFLLRIKKALKLDRELVPDKDNTVPTLSKCPMKFEVKP